MLNTIKNITNTKDKKRLLSNFFSLSILQVFTYILPLLTLPYLVRVLGVEKFGLVMFAQAFVMFLNVLVDYGFNLSATREISIKRDDRQKVTEIYSAVITIKILLIIFAFIILSIIVFSFEKLFSDWELYYLSFLLVIGQAMFPLWYFQGMEKMKYITIVNIISKVLFTVLIFIVIQDAEDYIYVPMINGFGFIIGGLISLWIIYKKFNQSFSFQSYSILKKYFIDSSQFFLSRAAVTMYSASNVLILGVYTSNTMVGYYSISERLYTAIQSLYNPVTQVLYPYVSKERNISLFKKVFYICVTINTLGIGVLFLVDEWIFEILFSYNLGAESIKVFEIFLMSALIMVPSTLLGYSYLGALGYAKYANFSVLYASFFHLLGLVFLVLTANITIYTVVVLVVFTQIVDFTYRLYHIKKKKLW